MIGVNMGYTEEGSITNFWPDNTETDFYLKTCGTIRLSDAIEQAAEHFKISTSELLLIAEIEAEHIHTRCLYYDCYDHGDWDYFIRICIPEKGR